jgi:hypothetical protein
MTTQCRISYLSGGSTCLSNAVGTSARWPKLGMEICDGHWRVMVADELRQTKRTNSLIALKPPATRWSATTDGGYRLWLTL